MSGRRMDLSEAALATFFSFFPHIVLLTVALQFNYNMLSESTNPLFPDLASPTLPR